MSTLKKLDAVNLLLSDARGIYIPQNFIEQFSLELWHIDANSWAAKECANPENENYWDAWSDILDQAFYTDSEGNKFTLYQDGDLWALCFERMTRDEKQNFGFEDDQS